MFWRGNILANDRNWVIVAPNSADFVTLFLRVGVRRDGDVNPSSETRYDTTEQDGGQKQVQAAYVPLPEKRTKTT